MWDCFIVNGKIPATGRFRKYISRSRMVKWTPWILNWQPHHQCGHYPVSIWLDHSWYGKLCMATMIYIIYTFKGNRRLLEYDHVWYDLIQFCSNQRNVVPASRFPSRADLEKTKGFSIAWNTALHIFICIFEHAIFIPSLYPIPSILFMQSSYFVSHAKC